MVSGALLTVLTVFPLSAQQAKTGTIGLYRNQQLAPDGPMPKMADGTPDLSGVWLGSGGGDADIANPKTLKAGEQVVMLPWAADVVKNRLSAGSGGELPAGGDSARVAVSVADRADADSLLHSL
jgi:hypothetical protein